jgi:hypothetical protein
MDQTLDSSADQHDFKYRAGWTLLIDPAEMKIRVEWEGRVAGGESSHHRAGRLRSGIRRHDHRGRGVGASKAEARLEPSSPAIKKALMEKAGGRVFPTDSNCV